MEISCCLWRLTMLSWNSFCVGLNVPGTNVVDVYLQRHRFPFDVRRVAFVSAFLGNRKWKSVDVNVVA